MSNSDYIFGIRAIIEAIRSGKTIDKIMIKKAANGELMQELLQLIKEEQLAFQSVPEQKLNRITQKNHQGAIAFLSPVPFQNFEEIITQTYERGETPFFLYLDQITDVRNFGAIVRTAECAGVHAIIVPEKGAAQINADAMKTSAGAMVHVPICKVRNPYNTMKTLQGNGFRIFAATEKAEEVYSTQSYTEPCTIVMGSEDTGIAPDIIRLADKLIKIPVLGKIQSLNVSVATGIILYEVVKQRQ
jgi:23S rRNA (guanosine2251-2'-O)-methyltransferase